MKLFHRIHFFIIIMFNFLNYGSIFSDIVSIITSDINAANNTDKVTANTSELITAQGFTAQTYQVITEDGYILTLCRIVNSGPVVFFMHGIICSSDEWCTQGSTALPFQLAEAGYDVYIGNTRGNKYSRKHISQSTSDRAFWNFSFHEIGYYDVPAMIDFALETSNKTKLVYVGQSQGTTVFYVMASLRPNYNDKISLMVSMATVAWFSHQKSVFFYLLTVLQYRHDLLADFGVNSVLEYDKFKIITTQFCPYSKLTMFLCATFIFATFGFDYPQINYTQFPAQIGHLPSGASVKQFLHYVQLLNSAKFRQFDYGFSEKNQIAYRSVVPPAYPVEKVTAPVAIMTGINDFISRLEDVNILISKLPNVVLNYTVSYESFGHTDFLWAMDAKDILYNKAMDLIESFAENI